MPWGLAAPLPEVLDLLEGQGISGQMKKRIQKSGTMTGGKKKTVAVRPGWVVGLCLRNPVQST